MNLLSAVSRSRSLVLASLAFVAAARAASLPLNLSEVQDFNLVTWGNATLLNSDTEGRVAVGGNATFSSYSIGTHAAVANPTTGVLVVGGNLTAGHGSVSRGSIYVGGNYSGPGYSLNTAAGSVTASGLGNAVPFSFAAAKAAMEAKAQAYGAQAATGSSVLQWSTLTLSGMDPDVNVFNITAAQLAAASSLVINAPVGAHVLVNVSGAAVTFSNKGLSGAFSPYTTLFNFYQATSVSMSGIGVQGSILAPFANVNFQGGQMNGQLIANSFAGAAWGVGEMHHYTFANQEVPPASVPDAAGTIGLLAGGFGALAVWRRRGLSVRA